MSTVKKLNYFGVCDFNYMESWLEDMACKGLLLKRQNLFTSEFEEGAPSYGKYRIIPVKYKKLPTEECKSYKEAGWIHIPASIEISIFYNDDPNASELCELCENDYLYNRRTQRALRTNAILSIALLVLLSVNFYIDSASLNAYGFGSMHALDISIVGFVTILSLAAAAVTTIVLGSVSGIRSYAKIRKKGVIEHGLSYDKVIMRCRIAYILLAISLSFGAVYAVNAFNGGLLSLNESLAYENPHLVRFSEFDEKTWDDYYDLVTGKRKDETGEYCTDYFINSETTLIREWAHESYTIDREIQDPEDESSTATDTIAYYSCEYSRFINDKAAEMFLEEDIAYHSTWDDDSATELKPDDISVDCVDIDYVGYYSEPKKLNYGGNQILYLRNGKKVMEIYYTGDKNLKDELAVFVQKLK